MNREIQELREVVQKLVPLLAGKGLTVTQRGSQAFVSVNPTTRKPEVVNIPSISDNAKPDFIRAIQGFIDHEVAHVLYTDWNYYGRGASAADLHKPEVQQFRNTHNIVEDTMIERVIVKDFPGSARNISDTRKYFLERITAVALKSAKTEKEAFIYLLVPLMRALAGHTEMQDFMDAGKYWKNKYVDAIVKGLTPATLSLLKTCTTTKETLAISEELHLLLYPPAPPAAATPPPPPPPPPAKPDPKKGKSEDKPEKEAGEGEGDGERDHKDEGDEDDKGEPGKSKDKSKDAEDKDDNEGEPDEGDGSSASDPSEQEDEEGDGTEGENDDSEVENDDVQDARSSDSGNSSDDEADEDDDASGAGKSHPGEDEEGDGEEGDGEEKESEASASGSASGGMNDGDSDGDDDGDSGSDGVAPVRTEGADGGGVGDIDVDVEDADSTKQNPGGGVGNQAGRSLFDFEGDAFEAADMSSQIAIMISDEAVLAMDPKQYKVFTREMDRIEPVFVPEKINGTWVPKMEDEVRSMTGRMQKDIERAMASQSHIIRTPGHKNGKLHAPSLFRVSQGDPRVFTQKQEHISKDTAVTLLCDNSGSMSGEKMKLAMISAYALTATLDRVKIAHEVLGFTSGGYYDVPDSIRQAMQDDIKSSKINYDRVEPIMIPIYKDFNERLTATVKARFAYMMNAQRGLQGNIDGESLEYAAMRLMKRTEKRKVMLVLSDGQPAGSSKSGPHLSYVVEELKKNGIECIGIGIMDRSVARYYPNHVVLHDVDQLPGEVMTEIKKILA